MRWRAIVSSGERIFHSLAPKLRARIVRALHMRAWSKGVVPFGSFDCGVGSRSGRAWTKGTALACTVDHTPTCGPTALHFPATAPPMKQVLAHGHVIAADVPLRT